MSKLNLIVGAIIVAIIVAFLIFGRYVMVLHWLPGMHSIQTGNSTAGVSTSSAVEQSLGGHIYSQINNPLQNRLPNSNPVKSANPVQGLYTNPF